MSQQRLIDVASRDLMFYLNGEKTVVQGADPTTLLIDYLRSRDVGCTGTKLSCGEGGCGACTVMLSHYDAAQEEIVNLAVNSCLRPLCSIDGRAVTTTEGIGSAKTELDPVQYSIAANNGSQCGYCTPGFVMNMFTLLQNKKNLTEQEIEDNFDGNICRCTGFRPILYAMKTFADDCNEGERKNTPQCGIDPNEVPLVRKSSEFTFPDELKTVPRALYFSGNGYQWFRPLELSQVYELVAEKTLSDMKLVVGNTSIGVYKKGAENPHILVDISEIEELKQIYVKDNRIHVGAGVTYTQFIEFVDSLIQKASADETAGLVELSYLAHRTASVQVRNAACLAGNLMMVVRHVKRGIPFPSDMFTGLAALNVEVTVGNAKDGTTRTFPTVIDFAESYNSDADRELADYGVVLSLEIPFTEPNEYVQSYKLARRIQNSHAIVNTCCRVLLEGEARVKSAALVFGGIMPVAFHASRTEQFLQGKTWSEPTLNDALAVLSKEVQQIINENREKIEEQPEEGISLEYRHALAETMFYKFFLHVASKVIPKEVQPVNESAANRYVRPVSTGQQKYKVQKDELPVSEPMIRLSAFLQASGEARYTHDIPLPPRGLEAAYVVSARAHAKFHYKLEGKERAADLDDLISVVKEKFPGVRDFITVRDIPENGVNMLGAGDDPIFCDGLTTCSGQSIGLVVADSLPVAEDAADYIQKKCIDYSEQTPLVLTIEEARALPNHAGIFQNNPPAAPYITHLCHIERRTSDKQWLRTKGALLEGCEVSQGSQRTGAQAHFYMETQSALVVPGEQKAVTVYASTQSPNDVQQAVAQALHITVNNVDVIVKRLGGGFGGKTTRTSFVSAAAAIASWKLNRPVRLAVERDVDTALIGKRHPFLGEYKVAYTADGEIKGLYTNFWSDGGNTYDCSFDVMDCAQLGADNAYNIDNFRTTGNVCITNKASNNAMRSYGLIQTVLVQEDAIERAAFEINKSRKAKVKILPEDIREKMLYQDGTPEAFDVTPYGQPLKYCYIHDAWDTIKSPEYSNFREREREVQEFNKNNRWLKRGISLIPLKYGLGYNLGWLEQGGAIINAYAADGSVLVEHGGIEMGQGLMTKMAQIAARALNIPLQKIQMDETNTNIIANPMSTGATAGTDLNGGAVLEAGMMLRERLQSFCDDLRISSGDKYCRENGIDYWNYREGWQAMVKKQGQTTKGLMWNNIISLANKNRIDLCAQALYQAPGLVNDEILQFVSFTYSAACAEVEIDVLTGESTILRADVMYDAGESLNPCLDIGQVEGAFVQGIGNVTTEEVVFETKGKRKGALNSINTWGYKPPCSKSIPVDFRVSLYSEHKRKSSLGVPINPNLMLSSKGTGEPPLVLASCVFFAIKHAILAAREDRGVNEWFELDSPATVQRIQEACAVSRGQLKL
jgi:xanthine dehydrogenase/oxidase